MGFVSPSRSLIFVSRNRLVLPQDEQTDQADEAGECPFVFLLLPRYVCMPLVLVTEINKWWSVEKKQDVTDFHHTREGSNRHECDIAYAGSHTRCWPWSDSRSGGASVLNGGIHLLKSGYRQFA